jgi:hypothetical protein
MSGPKSKPLGWGDLGELLYRELKIGEQASVLNTEYLHHGRLPGGHIDATLYQKFPNGRIYPVGKAHLDPKTLNEIK